MVALPPEPAVGSSSVPLLSLDAMEVGSVIPRVKAEGKIKTLQIMQTTSPPSLRFVVKANLPVWSDYTPTTVTGRCFITLNLFNSDRFHLEHDYRSLERAAKEKQPVHINLVSGQIRSFALSRNGVREVEIDCNGSRLMWVGRVLYTLGLEVKKRVETSAESQAGRSSVSRTQAPKRSLPPGDNASAKRARVSAISVRRGQQQQHPVRLDYSTFPTIFDEIINNPVCWTRMRAVSRALKAKVDARAFLHVVIQGGLDYQTGATPVVEGLYGYLPAIARTPTSSACYKYTVPGPPWHWDRSPCTPEEVQLVRSCISYLQHTRVVDTRGSGHDSVGLHLTKCFHALDVLRFYDCMAYDNRGHSRLMRSWPSSSVHPNTLIVLFPHIPNYTSVKLSTTRLVEIGARVGKVVVNVGYSTATGPLVPQMPILDWWIRRHNTSLANETAFIFQPLAERNMHVFCRECEKELSRPPPRVRPCLCSLNYRTALWGLLFDSVTTVLEEDITHGQSHPEFVPRPVRIVDFPDNKLDKRTPVMATKAGFMRAVEQHVKMVWAKRQKRPRPPSVVFQTLDEYEASLTPRQFELETQGSWAYGGW